MTNQNYWDQALEGAKEESTGGGVIGKCRLDLGYFAYVSGFTGDDRDKCVFLLDGQGKDARENARKAAQAFCTANGVETKNARWCAILRIYRDEAVRANGADVAWTNDQLETVPLWTLNQDGPSAARAVMDSIKEHNVPAAQDFYARVGWVADPFKQAQGEAGMTDADQEGNPRYPRIAVVQEVYPNKDAAAAAVGSGNGETGADSNSPAWAAGWKADDLAATVQAFKDEKDEYESFAELVEGEAGEDETWGVKLLSEIGGMSVDEIAEFTGLKKGQVRQALKD